MLTVSFRIERIRKRNEWNRLFTVLKLFDMPQNCRVKYKINIGIAVPNSYNRRD